MRVAADIGGTFTDLFVLDQASGAAAAFKTPTTPADPSEGLMTGLGLAAETMGFPLDQVALIIHGTTIATNAVLEDKLPRGALITTAGFEDVLEIGRHVRHDVYGLTPEPRRLIVPRENRFGIAERMTADGAVARPLDETALAGLIEKLRRADIRAVAICLLHAYANPDHEQRLAAAIRAALPDLPISLSSEVSPEIREYERSSTTALNALLTPVLSHYTRRLADRLQGAAVAAPVYLVQSNGGVASLETAAAQPARLLLSGPCGGTIAAGAVARSLDEPNLVAIDMGGTSFDVSLVHGGEAQLVTDGVLGGVAVRLPMVEIRTIGAGGGSIATVDAGGRLRVGPESAGADPGPACYGRGGSRATVTDANVVLGRLAPDAFLSGTMALDRDAAAAAIMRDVGDPLGLPLERAAAGLIAVAEASMAAAVRASLFEKGFDPQDFALVSFGGAAGLHAIALARDLDIRRVIFPRDPGTLSAYGMLHADIVHDFARTRLLPAEAASLEAVRADIGDLKKAGAARLAADRVPPARRDHRFAVDMRYQGQAFEVTVPWPEAEHADRFDDLLARFHQTHQQRFAYSRPGAPVDIVTLRLAAVGRLDKPAPAPPVSAPGDKPDQARDVTLGEAAGRVPVVSRASIAPGRTGAGPIIIEEPFTTLLVPAGWAYRCTADGQLVAEPEPGSPREPI